jgi:polygalacturonase
MSSFQSRVGCLLSILFLLSCSTSPPSRHPSSEPVCDVKTFGALGDGVTKDTAAIQAAIDSCAKTGGVVDLHDGTYLSGMITLRSNIDLRIEATATLKGSQDDADYPDTHPATTNGQLLNCNKTLIYANNATNLVIDGLGTIDGSGANPKWVGKEATRPMAIFIVLSTDVTIQDVTVKDAGMWGVVNMETNHLVIQRIHVHSPFGPTRDGIDIVDCHHVLIDSVDVYSEDDSICLKSGSAWGVYDVTVRNSHIFQSSVANALKLGTASSGSFKKVLFENIVIDDADKAAMAVESVDGAAIDGIQFQNIQFHKTGSAVFILLGRRGNPPQVGSIQNISFTNITGDTRHPWGSAISGTTIGSTTYSLQNINFNNVHVTNQGGLTTIPSDPPEYAGQYPDPNLWGNLPAFGYYIRHANGVSFDKASSTMAQPSDARPAIKKD